MANFSQIDSNDLNKYLDPKFAASHIDKDDLEKSAFSHHAVSRSDKIHSNEFATSPRAITRNDDYFLRYTEEVIKSEKSHRVSSQSDIVNVDNNADDSDYEPMGFYDSEHDVRALKDLRDKINGRGKRPLFFFLRELDFVIGSWASEHPNISEIFRPEEIDDLLLESIHRAQIGQYYDATHRFVQFLLKAEYKDGFVDDSKPRSLTRTTPVHRATGNQYTDHLVAQLFQIYDDPASNYVDAASGLSHFHAACQSLGCRSVVEKFLALQSEDDRKLCKLPNLLVEQTGDSPLHLALRKCHSQVIEPLLRNGADPNAINKEGLTPLHVISQKSNVDLLALFFKVCDEMQKTEGVKIDALNKSGRSPLHVSLANGFTVEVPLELLKRGANPLLPTEEGLTALHILCKREDNFAASKQLPQLLLQILEGGDKGQLIDGPDKSNQTPLHYALSNRRNSGKNNIAPFLLRHGADPNKANGQGSTPLHLICQRDDDDGLLDTFLEMCEELKLKVQADPRDESNRTPLQMAAAYLLPNAFSSLVKHGAQLRDFVFPAPDYFAKRFEAHPNVSELNFRINFAVRILSIIDRLERHKIQFDFASVRTVMDVFIKHNLFEMPEKDLDKYLDDSERRNMKSLLVGQGVSLADLIHMPQEEAEKNLTYLWYTMARRMFGLLSPIPRTLCDAKMCKILMKKHLRAWSSLFPSSARESIAEDATPEDWLKMYLKITNQSPATITDEEQLSTVPAKYHGRVDYKKFSSI